MAAGDPLRYRRLRAPTEDQTALIEPPLEETKSLLAKNQASTLGWDRLSGLPFSAWRRKAQNELLSWPGTNVDERAENPLILSGHQPTLFHPGVWLKNFVISRIASELGGDAINLIVDNDTIRTAAIRVPTGSQAAPRVVDIPFDAPSEEIPWEDRAVLDSLIFDTFADRVQDAFQSIRACGELTGPLLIERLWSHARQELDRSQIFDTRLPLNLGEALSRSRNRLERELGLKTQERELGLLCHFSDTYFQFFSFLLSHAARFHAVYNQALAEYRLIHGIRNTMHPVPDLARDGEWYEVPFWLWQPHEKHRWKAFARQVDDGWEISDRRLITVTSRPRTFWAKRDHGLIPMDELMKTSVKIRPRALITTMYARLVLSDLFIHGIGGAKYDEVTDAIIRRFFNIEPPGYVTATATVRLPLERPVVTPEDLTALDQEYRDTIHHPEEFVDDYSGHHQAEFAALVKQKQELIAHRWQEKQKKAWHDQVSAANERMSTLLEPFRDQLGQKRERLLADLHRVRILGSREYSFCLFPEDMLVPLLKKLAGIQS